MSSYLNWRFYYNEFYMQVRYPIYEYYYMDFFYHKSSIFKSAISYGTMYSRMDQVKFVEDSL